MDTFTAPQVCALVGCSYRQLDYWCRTDLMRPVVPARGSGSQRRFDAREAQCAWVLTQLSKLGAALADIECVRGIREWDGWLVITRDGCEHRHAPEWRTGIIVDLSECPITEPTLSLVAS